MAAETRRFHVAQFNVARMRTGTALHDPVMHGFTSRLDEINAVAERSPGFVWRLQTDEGNATSIRPYEDEQIVINLTVWESIDSLSDFVYRSMHEELVRGGPEWFERLGTHSLVLWWIPAGERPTVQDGKTRLERLRAEGPTPDAFTFQTTFPPPATQRCGSTEQTAIPSSHRGRPQR
jgi:hypothetical protein